MIANRERTIVLSSLGWVEGDAIWCCEVASGRTRAIPLNTGARCTSLHATDTERFVAVHHFDGARFMASVCLFAAPEVTVASAAYENGRTSITGAAASWNGLPHLYVTRLAAPWNDHVLIRIEQGHVHIQRLEWFDASYDKNYQGLADVIAMPNPQHALISVQRSSELILHDLETGKAVRKISIGASHGNPKLALRSDGREVWAADYDTLVVLDTRSWKAVRKKRLERAAAATGQFVGDYSFSADGTCCISRPYSGDVVVVDERLKVQRTAATGRQPLEAVELPDGSVIARDWKTGDLVRGTMQPLGWMRRLWR